MCLWILSGVFYSDKIIQILGWLPVAIGTWKKFPQMFKIYWEKSVEGFSLGFILICILAYSFEMFAGFVLGLPLQILANDFRGLFAYLVFLFQFFLYKKRSIKNFDVYA